MPKTSYSYTGTSKKAEGFLLENRVINIEEIKDQFKKKIWPNYGKLLKKYAVDNAKRHSRTGQLVKGIYVTGGKTGAGRNGVALGVKGPAAKYAGILDRGGWAQYKGNYLTIPTKFNLDRKGRVKTTMKETGRNNRRYFAQWVSRGKLAKGGPRFYFFQKERRALLTLVKRRVRGADGKLRRKPLSVTPLFELKTEHYTAPTYWATNAFKRANKELHKIMVQQLKIRKSKRK